jgi:hypothetical protein
MAREIQEKANREKEIPIITTNTVFYSIVQKYLFSRLFFAQYGLKCIALY